MDDAVSQELRGMVISSGLIGLILGFMGRGLLNLTEQQLVNAAVNGLLFAGWGLVETLAVVAAANAGLARSRGARIVCGALGGGLYIGALLAIETSLNMDFGGLVLFAAVGGFILGFLVGSLLSAVCVIRISGVVESPPAPDRPAGERTGLSTTARVLLAVGVGCAGLLLVAVVGVVVLVGVLAPSLDEGALDPELSTEEVARFFVPSDERIFPASAGADLILEVDGTAVDGTVGSTTAVVAGPPDKPSLQISAEVETSAGVTHPVTIRVDQPLWEHIEIGRPMLLNDPRPTGAVDHLEVALGGNGGSSRLSSALGEDLFLRQDLVGGRVTFAAFEPEPGGRLAGVVEARLAAAEAAEAGSTEARLLLRFDTRLAGSTDPDQ
jgi:hypothetical protein